MPNETSTEREVYPVAASTIAWIPCCWLRPRNVYSGCGKGLSTGFSSEFGRSSSVVNDCFGGMQVLLFASTMAANVSILFFFRV